MPKVKTKKVSLSRKLTSASPIEQEIEQVLESVRPMLALHRGDVDFVSFDPANGLVQLRLKGTCHGCPLSQLTLKSGIEEVLKGTIHGIERVEAVE